MGESVMGERVMGERVAGKRVMGERVMGERVAGNGIAASGGGDAAGGGASNVDCRLERIKALDRERAPVGKLLGELRELVREAESSARIEGDRSAPGPDSGLHEEAEGMS